MPIQNHKTIYYNGNPRIKKAGVAQKYTKQQYDEYQRCKEDIVYFCLNYVKIVTLDHGLQPFKLFEFQKRMLLAFMDNRFVINLLPRQMGKMLSLDTPLPTPDGWTTMGECQVGDEVMGRDGKPTKIIFKSPIQEIDTYEIEFDNGEVIKACSEHLWNVSHADWNHNEKTLTTRKIIEKFESLKNIKKPSSLYININEPLQLPEANLEIDPYLLGVWLGDGNSNDDRITCHINDYSDYKSFLGNAISEYRESSKGFKVYDILDDLKSLNLIGNKHIPNHYLRGSVEQRVQLLRGLMDTDGSVEKTGRCEFYQKKGVLINQVQELLSSLGIKHKTRWKVLKTGEYATISFCTNYYDVFMLQRKLDRQRNLKNHPKNYRHYIKGIRTIETEPMQCIGVDNDDHLYLAGKTMVPTHNSTVVGAYLLHYAIFHSDKIIGILANKGASARKVLARIQKMLENLPFWLQPGCTEVNKGNIAFANGSNLVAASTSSDSVRDDSMNVVYLDEFAFVEHADEFYTSTYPVISSGQTTQVLITSTPKGMNLFHKMWKDAIEKRSEFIPIQVHWSEHPDRDEEWARKTIANTSQKQFDQEYGCEFHGSSATLIAGKKLAALTYEDPIQSQHDDSNIMVYENPVEDHVYVATVDVAEGTGNDYSVITIFDVTEIPYKQVCVYKDNEVLPMVLPEYVNTLAKHYNYAYVMFETNSIGSQSAYILYHEYEYENMIMTQNKDGDVQVAASGSSEYGLRTKVNTKRKGCTNLKSLIENDLLLVKDESTVYELQTFSKKGTSYEAEEGHFDDTVMSLVLFAWLTTDAYFTDIRDIDTRKHVNKSNQTIMENDLVPFGYINDGMDGMEDSDLNPPQYNSVFL